SCSSAWTDWASSTRPPSFTCYNPRGTPPCCSVPRWDSRPAAPHSASATPRPAPGSTRRAVPSTAPLHWRLPLLCRGHRRLAPEHLASPQQLVVSKRTTHNLDAAVKTLWTTFE